MASSLFKKIMLASQSELYRFYKDLENLLRKVAFERRFQGPLLIVLGTIIYLPLFNNWFSGLAPDDNWMVYENPYIANLEFANIKEYFTSIYNGQYSPINTLMYGVVYHFFGLDPIYFHLASFFLHLCNAILVLVFVRSILRWRHKHALVTLADHHRQTFVAFIAALLFLIHPIQVESVVWISASKVLLYSFFCLLSLIFYVRYISTGTLWYLVISLIFFLFSFGAKEQAVVFPLLLVLIDFFGSRRLTSGRVLFEKLPFALLAIIFSLLSLAAQETIFSLNLGEGYYPLSERIILACFSYTEYIIKLFVPLNLSYWYPFPVQPGEALPLKLYFYLIAAIVYAYFVIRWCVRKRFVLVFGNLFLLVNVFLTLHVVPMARENLMADRYLYLGSVGIFFVAGHYFTGVLKSLPQGQKSVTLSLLFLFYICGLSTYTWLYIDRWNIG